MGKTGYFIGTDRGHITTPCKPDKRVKHRKNKGNRVTFIRNIVREVVGFAPYEKRLMDLLRADDSKRAKKGVQIARKRLGTHKRALHKQAELQKIIDEKK